MSSININSTRSTGGGGVNNFTNVLSIEDQIVLPGSAAASINNSFSTLMGSAGNPTNFVFNTVVVVSRSLFSSPTQQDLIAQNIICTLTF